MKSGYEGVVIRKVLCNNEYSSLACILDKILPEVRGR